MKRYGNLWDEIISFENLHLAAKKAQRGKREWPNVLAFNDRLEDELFQLQAELTGQTYRCGEYRSFIIYEPATLTLSVQSWLAHLNHANSKMLKTDIFSGLTFQRGIS